MKTFEVPTRDQVDATGQQIFDSLQQKLGMVPNLYATIAYSSNALASYLEFQAAQAKGSFKAKEREAIFLAVSEVNQCQYCLAVHTAVGKMNGFSEEETLQLRDGTHPNARLQIITRLAAEITRSHGEPGQDLLDEFFEQGFDNAALIDLVTLVADKTLANYVHKITQVPIDFPAAKPITAKAGV